MEQEKHWKNMRKYEAFIKMLGSRGAIFVLQFLDENKTAKYRQLQEYINTHTLNTRTKDLLQYELIQHHMTREGTRQEWYELTEKGRKVLNFLNKLMDMVD
jgi:DNA-binding HxlR family transcriptional regulator